MPDNWPKISVITPSFNQGEYIETTIRSVLSQEYPNVEYIVIDGGSTDGTRDIIRKYESRVSYWISERDRGQTHAINKGLEVATGEILAYLNSDDYYLPGALSHVAQYAREHPEVDLIHGRCRKVDAAGRNIGSHFASISEYREIVDLWNVWWKQRQFVQPEVFWTRRIANQIGPFREELQFVMDYDYWARILRAGGQVGRIDAELSCFRFQPAQKSGRSAESSQELLQVVKPLIWEQGGPLGWRQRLRLQGAWHFDATFRQAAAASIQQGESRTRRWCKLGRLTLSRPQLFAARAFRTHLVGNALRMVGART